MNSQITFTIESIILEVKIESFTGIYYLSIIPGAIKFLKLGSLLPYIGSFTCNGNKKQNYKDCSSSEYPKYQFQDKL